MTIASVRQPLYFIYVDVVIIAITSGLVSSRIVPAFDLYQFECSLWIR